MQNEIISFVATVQEGWPKLKELKKGRTVVAEIISLTPIQVPPTKIIGLQNAPPEFGILMSIILELEPIKK